MCKKVFGCNGLNTRNIMFFKPDLLTSGIIDFRPRHMMSSIQVIVREASLVPVHLPNINALKEALTKARDWSDKVDHVQVIILYS